MTQLELFPKTLYPIVTMHQRSEALVVAMVGQKAAPDWWASWNRGIGGIPEVVWKTNPQLVYDYLMGMAAGVYW